MIIQKLKDSMGIFRREQATSVNWPEVIENIELEAPLVECEPGHFTQGYGWFGNADRAPTAYTGIPAPVYLKDDEWFGPAPPRTQKQIDYMEQEIKMKRQEFENNFSVESEDIHQKMYEIATRNHDVTLDYDYSGGSENFLDGDSNGYGWMSGTGRE